MLTLSDNYQKFFSSPKILEPGLTVCAKLAGYMHVYKTQRLIDFEVATGPVPVH